MRTIPGKLRGHRVKPYEVMQLDDAISLIKKVKVGTQVDETWADLGSGRGLFTHALKVITPAGSTIHAIDIEQQDFHDYPSSVIFHLADFSKDELNIPLVDGILMANSLHYVKDQLACIQQIKKYLKVNGQLVLIEYDTETSNQWVPYPISFARAQELFHSAGFSTIEKMAERPSLYRRDPIYSALII